MRHAVERSLAAALPEPAPAVVSDAGLRQQVIAALGRAGEHVGGWTVAVKPQQTEDAPGAAADHVELLVRRDQVVAEQLRRRMRVREQVVVAQALRHHGERIDDRAQPGGAAGAQRSRHARRVAALEGSCADARPPPAPAPWTTCFPSSRHGRREKARCRCRRCKDRRRAARAAQPRNLPASRARSRLRPDPCGWRSARAPRRSCRPPRGSSPCAAQSPRRCARLGFVLARPRPCRSERETVAVFCRMTSTCQAILLLIEVAEHEHARDQDPASPRSESRCRLHRRSRCRRSATRNAGHSAPASAARSARCNGHSGSEALSQSASLARKSACADQMTPSSMLR